MTLPLETAAIADQYTRRALDLIAQQFPLAASSAAQAQVPQVRVSRSTTQAITTATFTAVSFDTVEFDKGSSPVQWVVGSPTKLTAQRAGCYIITGGTEWAASAAGNQRLVFVRVNGSAVPYKGGQGTPFSAAIGSATSVGEIITLTAGDFVELVVYQDTGGNLNITVAGQLLPHMSMVWVSP